MTLREALREPFELAPSAYLQVRTHLLGQCYHFFPDRIPCE